MFNIFKTKDIKIDEPHVVSTSKENNLLLYEKFIKEYDDKNLEFNNLRFRSGAIITEPFGLQNGFRMINNQMEWGWVRCHQGVDRSNGRTIDGYEDAVINPFFANRSFIVEYGDRSYGTLISLFNDEYGFEFRIAHMNPNQRNRKHNEKGPLRNDIYRALKRKNAIARDVILGSAGSLGASTAAHTHTEIKSISEECDVLELLLEDKFSNNALTEYSESEIISLYKKQQKYKNSSNRVILKDYAQLRKDRNILFLNNYKCQYIDNDRTIKTRYSTQSLFNGL